MFGINDDDDDDEVQFTQQVKKVRCEDGSSLNGAQLQKLYSFFTLSMQTFGDEATYSIASLQQVVATLHLHAKRSAIVELLQNVLPALILPHSEMNSVCIDKGLPRFFHLSLSQCRQMLQLCLLLRSCLDSTRSSSSSTSSTSTSSSSLSVSNHCDAILAVTRYLLAKLEVLIHATSQDRSPDPAATTYNARQRAKSGVSAAPKTLDDEYEALFTFSHFALSFLVSHTGTSPRTISTALTLLGKVLGCFPPASSAFSDFEISPSRWTPFSSSATSSSSPSFSFPFSPSSSSLPTVISSTVMPTAVSLHHFQLLMDVLNAAIHALLSPSTFSSSSTSTSSASSPLSAVAPFPPLLPSFSPSHGNFALPNSTMFTTHVDFLLRDAFRSCASLRAQAYFLSLLHCDMQAIRLIRLLVFAEILCCPVPPCLSLEVHSAIPSAAVLQLVMEIHKVLMMAGEKQESLQKRITEIDAEGMVLQQQIETVSDSTATKLKAPNQLDFFASADREKQKKQKELMALARLQEQHQGAVSEAHNQLQLFSFQTRFLLPFLLSELSARLRRMVLCALPLGTMYTLFSSAEVAARTVVGADETMSVSYSCPCMSSVNTCSSDSSSDSGSCGGGSSCSNRSNSHNDRKVHATVLQEIDLLLNVLPTCPFYL